MQQIFFMHLSSGPGQYSLWCEGSEASPSISSCDLWSLHLPAEENTLHSVSSAKGSSVPDWRCPATFVTHAHKRCAGTPAVKRCCRSHALRCVLPHQSSFFSFSYTIARCTPVNELFIATGAQVSKACGTTLLCNLLSHTRYPWRLCLSFRLLSTWRN